MKRITNTRILVCTAIVAFIARPTGAGFIADLIVFTFLALVFIGCAATVRAILPTKE